MSESKQSSGNVLRQRLAAGEFAIGTTVVTGNLESAVFAAKLDFHFLWVEMEHSRVSLEALRAILLGTAGLGTPAPARVPVVALWTAKRVMDQGVRGVIFPFMGDSELVRTAAQACRYPPTSLRGSGAGLTAAAGRRAASEAAGD